MSYKVTDKQPIQLSRTFDLAEIERVMLGWLRLNDRNWPEGPTNFVWLTSVNEIDGSGEVHGLTITTVRKGWEPK